MERIMKKPLVSVLVLSKDSAVSIRRCLDALVKQDYPNLEIIIQDGQSTDETLDIINSYEAENIFLDSQPDEGGASEGFYKGLKRCRGDILTLCWSDEELFPHTVSWGVEQLEKRPGAAGVYGGVMVTDLSGAINGGGNADIRMMSFDLEKALCWEQLPNYVTSFLRRSVLEESGFFERVASYYEAASAPVGCIMYEYFCLPGLKRPIYAIPHFMGKFASHKQQLCSNPKILLDLLAQLQHSLDYILGRPDTPDWVHQLDERARAGFHLMMIPNLVLFNFVDEAYEIFSKALTYNYRIDFLRGIIRHSIQHLHDEWRYEQSLKFLQLCLLHDPGNVDWQYLKGFAELRLGNYDDAIASFRCVLGQKPDDKRAYRHLIRLLIKKSFLRPEAKEEISTIFNLKIANELRYHELADKLVLIVTSGKNVAAKMSAIRGFSVTKAFKLLTYLIEVAEPDVVELQEICVATRYFIMSCFSEY